jgi:hypothetical protein
MLARDLIPDLEAPRGVVIEKVEGLAVLPDGTAIIATASSSRVSCSSYRLGAFRSEVPPRRASAFARPTS